MLTILKNTNQEAVIKCTGVDETCTVTRSALTNNYQQIGEETLTLNIVGVSWVGEPGSSIVITRDGTIIFSLPGDQPQMFNFQGQGFVDSVNNDKDIYIEITGTASVYLILRKDGWLSKIETATFSIYDDVTQAGS